MLTKQCQNCKLEFIVEDEDLAYYKKIYVPPPTFCPECRIARRFTWRNMWHLYKKKEERTGELIFSTFPEESPVKIYDRDFWWTDGWDPLEYGQDIDWNIPFFSQFYELMKKVPFAAHSSQSLVNCEYCMNASYSKNCYYSRALGHTEDCTYVIWDEASKNCMDSHMTDHCEFGYGNVNAIRCYQTSFSVNCEDCTNVILSRDCNGCSSCIGCVGLRGKSYHIFNQPYSKEEYVKKVAEMNLGSRKSLSAVREQAEKVWASFPVKYMHGVQNADVTGDYIYNSKNSKQCYRVKETEDSKFCMNLLNGPVKDSYDYANWGAGSELIYESLVCGDQTYNIKFSWNVFGGAKNVEYSVFCPGGQDLFGCVGAHKKQYCILNKQYTKEEYEQLVPKLKKHMTDMPYVDKLGRVYTYGEFFPAELSPFPYNVSESHEYFPKTKEEVLREGMMWHDDEKRAYTITKQSAELPDSIKDATPDIVKETIACRHEGTCLQECTTAFRIIPREFEFLKRFNIPLPDLCPNCRQYERFALRNLPKFYNRNCQCAGITAGQYANTAKHFHGEQACPNTFQTSYAPSGPEIVYCEQCYNAEVV
jgi:hypothetical protein